MKLLLLNHTHDPALHLQGSGQLTDVTDLAVNDVILLTGTQCQVLNAPMPIKQPRQIIKALPFALEDQLANELEQNHLVFLGRDNGQAYAATISHQTMASVSQTYPVQKMFFAPLLLPCQPGVTSILIVNGQACVRLGECSAFSVPRALLALTLERHLAQDNANEAVTLCFAEESDELLHVQLENLGLAVSRQSFTEVYEHLAAQAKQTKNNLLSGPYQPKIKEDNAATQKFKGVFILAASVFVMVVASNWLSATQQNNLAASVQAASKQYYQTLFPDETVRRGLKRMFNDKLETASPSAQGSTGFTQILAQASAQIRQNKDAQLQSVRFASNKGVLEMSLLTLNIAQLDSIKQQLEKNGLRVEIASANNDGKRIKGLLKVSSNG
jgi:Type II secretory pathway, component PulL